MVVTNVEINEDKLLNETGRSLKSTGKCKRRWPNVECIHMSTAFSCDV